MPFSRPLQRQRGFALLWAIMTIGIVTVLMGAVAPALLASREREAVLETYGSLAEMDSGIVRFGTLVKRVGTVYPGLLSELTTVVAAGDPISCSTNTMNPNSITTWTTNGPFASFYIPAGGPYTPLGRVNDAIEHAAANQPMYIRIPGVNIGLVQLLDLEVDNGDLGAAGKVQYGAAVSGVTDVLYRIGVPPTFTLKSQC